MNKLFEAFCRFWGSTGYLYYELLLKNNNSTKLNQQELIEFEKIINDFIILEKSDDDEYNDMENDDYCDLISQYINEKFFSHIMKNNSQINSNNLFFIKLINIDNIEKIEPNRWMSFSKSVDLNEFALNDTFGKSVLIFKESTINFVDMLNYGDNNEVLINSNEILPFITTKKFGYIPEDNGLHTDIDILISELKSGNQTEIFYEILKKYELKPDNVLDFIYKYIPKHYIIPLLK